MAVSTLLDLEIQCAMCFDHWSFWSKITPKTLMLESDLIVVELSLISIGEVSFFLNKHRQVLASFTFIPDFLSQLSVGHVTMQIVGRRAV